MYVCIGTFRQSSKYDNYCAAAFGQYIIEKSLIGIHVPTLCRQPVSVDGEGTTLYRSRNVRVRDR